ncbi:hypothetical protein JDO7802_01098 [Jannaschia donghaensis]|uniref:Uncharacterized protein n=2 Tax=Jannaschia donghaensis TaxID=420998 RepID=A0A0M6YFH5_9RHOB|nr:hypothetical protein JDO7802_01098 [Jannaschia donghaensis]
MALWCRVLTKRLRAFNDVDSGLGGTIATLTKQVDDLKASIDTATECARDRADLLEQGNARADDRIGRMEMLLVSLEDLEGDVAEHLLQDEASAQVDMLPSFRASRPDAVASEGHR